MKQSSHSRFRWVALFALGAWTAFPGLGTAQTDEYAVSGDRVEVYNLAGRVEVVAGSGPDVIVEVTRGGKDARELRMEQDRGSFRVIYPDDRIVYPEMGRRSRAEIRVDRDGRFSGNWGGDRVRISGEGSGLEAWADLTVRVPAGVRVEVFQAVGRIRAAGVQAPLRLDTGSGSVVAVDIVGNLVVDTGSGAVELEDVEGEVTVDTGSGSVRLRNVSGPEIYVDTGSGSVSGTGLRTERLRVDTGSGRVELETVASSEIEIDTGSGGVRLDLVESFRDLVVDTGSGEVLILAPADLDAEVEIDTGSGGIDVDFPVQVREMERNYLEGTIGEGRGRIEIDTGSGGVRIERR